MPDNAPWVPAADLSENDQSYIVHVEVPGVRKDFVSDIKPDQVSAELADGVLTVTVPKSEQAKPRQVEVAG